MDEEDVEIATSRIAIDFVNVPNGILSQFQPVFMLTMAVTFAGTFWLAREIIKNEKNE